MASSDDTTRVAREKAWLLYLLGLQPSEYDQLTDVERAACVDLANQITERHKMGG